MYWSSDSDKARSPLNQSGVFVLIVLGAVMLTAVGAFTAGYWAATNAPGSDSLALVREAYEIVNRDFYYEKPADAEQAYGAISGLLSSFGDPHTLFLPPVPAQQDRAVLSGAQGGVGATLRKLDTQELAVVEIHLGWPFEEAGGRVGDVITAVDGKPVADLSLEQAVSLIRGPLGTPVTLTLRRAGSDAPITLTVTRAQINVYGTLLPDDIAYLSLGQFTATAPDDVKAQLERLLASQPRALILDLRNNGGGYLQESIQIADLFLSEGPVASEKSVGGDVRRYTARSGEIGEKVPLVVLVNGYSASASEIVAGALQDRGRAVLVGQRTFGKGSVQVLHTLSDGSQLRVTRGAWYTPDETPIQAVGDAPGGLLPDVVVERPADATDQPGTDPERTAAVEYILKHY